MHQHHARLALRILILGSAFLGLVGMVIALAGDGFLPKELADWQAAQQAAQQAEDEGALILGFILILPVIAALLASLVGLFLFKKWAAWLYLAITVIGSVFMLLEPTVESGVAAFFTYLEAHVSGVILGVAFFSSALEPDQNS